MESFFKLFLKCILDKKNIKQIQILTMSNHPLGIIYLEMSLRLINQNSG